MIETTLVELTLNITDGKHGDCQGENNSGYYFISCKDVKDGVINYGEARQITEKDFLEVHKRTLLEPNDILLTNSGTIGRMAFVKDTPKTYKTTFQKSVAIIKPNPNKILPQYLYYLLQYCVDDFINQSNGSAQKNLLLSTMRSFKMKYHTNDDIQNKIVGILSAYDKLIENNQKQIKLLEEAAQRLYKEWFVDLRFPGHENTKIVDGVPEGWKKISLGEIIGFEIGGGWGEEQPTEKCDQPAYVIRGTDIHDVTHGNAKSIPYRYHAQSNLASRILQDGDIVFEVSGGSKNEGVARTALITQSLIDFINENIICASFCKLIRVKDRRLSKYIYDLFQYLRKSGETVKYDKRSASSIVNYRWKDFLEQQMIFVPTEDVLNGYNAVAEHIQKSIVNKAKIIEQAKEARDRLLPKLMSGELEV